ncbi:unnamed protein product [Phytomonas sp. EM1]|nr:unnamed protein product [Phytomonas sp. EM1]|eukprot:CCW62484.1 unnamed protein product [Phytomonas sp. isolate EM1]
MHFLIAIKEDVMMEIKNYSLSFCQIKAMTIRWIKPKLLTFICRKSQSNALKHIKSQSIKRKKTSVKYDLASKESCAQQYYSECKVNKNSRN